MKRTSKFLFTLAATFSVGSLIGCDIRIPLPEKDVYYTVQFDGKDYFKEKIPSQKVKKGEKVKKPTVDPKTIDETKIFDNYYLNGKVYDFNSPVNSNLTINVTAKNYYHEVTFNPTSLSEENPFKVKVLNSKSLKETYPGEKQPTPEPKDNTYHFYNWLDEDDKPFDFSSKITKPITLKANYTLNWIEISSTSINVDVNSSSPYTLTASIDGQSITDVTFSVREGYKDIIEIKDNNKLSAVSGTDGGIAYIEAKATKEGKTYYGYFIVTVGSFSQLDDQQLKNNRAVAKGGAKNKVVVPSYYYDGNDWYDINNWHAIKYIPSLAFINKTYVTDIVLPNTILSISDRAFEGCTTLATVKLGNNLSTIGERAFLNCISLREINIPSSITKIEPNAFYGSGLYLLEGSKAYFEKPDSWTYSSKNILVSYALLSDPVKAAYCISFLYNDDVLIRKEDSNPLLNLESVKLEKNDSYISCANLYSNQNVKYSTSSDKVAIVNDGIVEATGVGEANIIATNEKGTSVECKVTVQNSEELIEKTTSSGDHGAIGVRSRARTTLDYVCIPKSIKYEEGGETKTTDVKYIADSGFTGTPLKTIYINENILGIEDYAFYSSSIEQIVFSLSSNCSKIGSNAFKACSGLNYINLPEKYITEIGEYAFAGCNSLSGITLPSNSSFTTLNKGLFVNCMALTSIIIPQNIKKIEDIVFNGCNKLQTIIYLGTVNEFTDAVGDKKSSIFDLVPTRTVTCSDGDFTIR